MPITEYRRGFQHQRDGFHHLSVDLLQPLLKGFREKLVVSVCTDQHVANVPTTDLFTRIVGGNVQNFSRTKRSPHGSLRVVKGYHTNQFLIRRQRASQGREHIRTIAIRRVSFAGQSDKMIRLAAGRNLGKNCFGRPKRTRRMKRLTKKWTTSLTICWRPAARLPPLPRW